MMAPTLVFDGDGLELALGAAGGTRLRTALVGVLAQVLHDGAAVQDAIDRPRFHPAGQLVNAEPGVDEAFCPRSKRAAGRFAGGLRCTTTSAASARSVARARAPIRGGAEQSSARCRETREAGCLQPEGVPGACPDGERRAAARRAA